MADNREELLLEDGVDKLMLEDGTGNLLLESAWLQPETLRMTGDSLTQSTLTKESLVQ